VKLPEASPNPIETIATARRHEHRGWDATELANDLERDHSIAVKPKSIRGVDPN